MRFSIAPAIMLCLTAAAVTQLSCARLQPRAGSHKSIAPAAAFRGGEKMRVSDLIQVPVRSKQGESLGRVQDLIVDPTTGQIESALVSKGFLIGQGSLKALGEIVVPVPWQALNLSLERRWVLRLDQQKLSAEGGSQGHSD